MKNNNLGKNNLKPFKKITINNTGKNPQTKSTNLIPVNTNQQQL